MVFVVAENAVGEMVEVGVLVSMIFVVAENAVGGMVGTIYKGQVAEEEISSGVELVVQNLSALVFVPYVHDDMVPIWCPY